MDSQTLDEQIATLERAIPDKPGILTGYRERFDWKALPARAREIQAGFSSGVRYLTVDERQRAWERFDAARSRLRASNEADWEHRKRHSGSLRNELLGMANRADLPGATEAFLGLISGVTLLFGGLTDEDVREKGRQLREAGRTFSEWKREMLRDDKDRVFERIREVQHEHDVWWTGYKRERSRQHEERQAEWRRGTLERIAKAERNLASNLDRYERAAGALARVRANVAENEAKRASATSAEWRDRFDGWVREGEAQARDIEEQMDRIRRWIEQDRERITELRAKL